MIQAKLPDLSPLADLPLADVHVRCDPDCRGDLERLRQLKSLKKINGLPADEFWKQVAAGKSPYP